ncbi:MAG: helix-turn-helix transcriptional regulator [Bacteroidaceae bacterium]|nr:helix-turn-helix transcriptional regulator [Bacteroidaceae bacterium]
MYTLKEAWILMHGEPPIKNWDGKMFCSETDAAITYRANETHGYMAAYTFTLVTDGWLDIIYNGHELTLQPDDLYIYSPGLPVTIVSASENYRGICLLADEETTFRTPSVRDLVSLAYNPLVQLHEPKLKLPPDVAHRLSQKMRDIIDIIHTDHIYKNEILQMLYGVFLLDMQSAQDQAFRHHRVPQRVEEIFLDFMRLLPHHFAAHHGIQFYAHRLHITDDYLSRIVRQVTGRTVVDYINQLLLMEASFLLRTTSLSITQIADRLHFADTPSFSKFFSRLKGVSPKKYRSR